MSSEYTEIEGFEDSRFVPESHLGRDWACSYCGHDIRELGESPQNDMCGPCYGEELANWEETQAHINYLWRTR